MAAGARTLENMVSGHSFWHGKSVFITGHTGFKGSWLALWLHSLGARISGYALPPSTDPSLYELLDLHSLVNSDLGDIGDFQGLKQALNNASPEVVFHLAAQPLVRASYQEPVETYGTNVMGAVHLLQAVRSTPSVRAVLIVTSDKCYENREWLWGYRENDRLGGHDPYSNSKACAELVTKAYTDSFFAPQRYGEHRVSIASARAGNVIGGGDWSQDRLLPDAMRAFVSNEPLSIRSPHAVRPWQHVLEPLWGYILLAERLCAEGPRFNGAWNFGPAAEGMASVKTVVDLAAAAWNQPTHVLIDAGPTPHEAGLLMIDATKSQQRLGWKPVFALAQAVQMVVTFTRAWQQGSDLRKHCLSNINEFTALHTISKQV